MRISPRLTASQLAISAFIAAVSCASVSCAKPVKVQQPTLHVVSEGLDQGGNVPAAFTCDGDNVSPPLRWSRPPSSTQSIAVICDDTDAPDGTFTHWILYNLPAGARKLPQSVSPIDTLASGARQGKNDFDKLGYSGPCPPSGPAHHYHFHVYALATRLTLPNDAVRSDFDNAIQGHILAQGQLDATYGRT